MYYESLTYISVNTICPAMFWSYGPKRAKTPAIESKVEGRLTLVGCNEFRPHMTQLLKSGKKFQKSDWHFLGQTLLRCICFKVLTKVEACNMVLGKATNPTAP